MRQRIAALVIVASAVACGEQAPPPPEGAGGDGAMTPAPALLTALSDEQAEGRAIYQSVCWTCHGAGGRGDGPVAQTDTVGVPQDFIAGDYADLSVDDLVDRFEASLTGDGVDPDHPHMQSVVELLKPDRFRTALSYIPVLAYPPEIPGSALTGMDLYQTRCAACHGERGDGQGYAAEALKVMKPADFRADTLVAAGDWDGLFHRIRLGGRTVHGSSMPPWGEALSDTEIWDLVAYVATFEQGALPPLPGRGP
ncbi:MAG TPA: c-type cytochrome [Longimicrobiales bacterium]|nr:c-type cytochrome [Longimicrobiales bacterium]